MSTALTRSALGDVDVVEVPQVLDEVVAARESLVAHPRAVFHRAGEIRSADSMYGGLVPLQVCEPGEVGA